MKIAISGLTGVGKTTTADHVSRLLGIPHISFSMKEEARKRGMSILELQEIAKQDSKLDLEFDRVQVEEMKMHEDFVTSTWLGPWFANADINVWLYAEDSIRAKRVAERDALTYDDASNLMLLKDAGNKERYSKLYNIDITNTNKFHICINTGMMGPERVAQIIINALEVMKKDKGEM